MCAFPADAKTQTDGGLTKREYFSAMAMQGILSNQEGVKALISKNISIDEYAVKCADALLHQLEKNNEL